LNDDTTSGPDEGIGTVGRARTRRGPSARRDLAHVLGRGTRRGV